MLLTRSDLSGFDATDDLADQAHALLEQQKRLWEQCRRGYETLATVLSRTFDLDGSQIIAQFNPGRIASSTAKTDPDTIAQRKCFLCPENLPADQRAIEFAADPNYLILVNPFPIFPEHFTIPHKTHTPQRIVDTFPTMLALAKALASRYTVFYNGPRCGASAPDHLHFQAGTKRFMPIQTQSQTARGADARRFLVLEGRNAARLSDAFAKAYATMQQITSTQDEPMMNVLATFDAGEWRVLIFPRAKHRPSFYSATGDDQLLLSPAAVEMGGVCTLPVEAHFNRLTRDHLVTMYREVSWPDEQFAELTRRLS
jgi:ATP adenylyltransferase/5',5'''-P-1,P-4-tetraphosphate phosphorylase II